MAGEDRELSHIRKHARSTVQPKSWPAGVYGISQQGLGLLGIHERTNELYWDGVPIVTKRFVRLEGWTFALAAVATGSTVVAALWPIAVHMKWLGP